MAHKEWPKFRLYWRYELNFQWYWENLHVVLLFLRYLINTNVLKTENNIILNIKYLIGSSNNSFVVLVIAIFFIFFYLDEITRRGGAVWYNGRSRTHDPPGARCGVLSPSSGEDSRRKDVRRTRAAARPFDATRARLFRGGLVVYR